MLFFPRNRTATFQHERAERSLVRATVEPASRFWHRKSMKSMKERRPASARSEFPKFFFILFRISEIRSVWRTNLVEQAEMEQLVKWRRRASPLAALPIEIKLFTLNRFEEMLSEDKEKILQPSNPVEGGKVVDFRYFHRRN